MGGGTGNIRTQRVQSGTVGMRTLGSILAGGGGAGSLRRVNGWYCSHQQTQTQFYQGVFGIRYGQFANNKGVFLIPGKTG